MARYSFVGTTTRILILLILVVALGVFSLWWFNFLGVINTGNLFEPVLKLVGLKKESEILNVEDPLLLDKQRMNKLVEALDIREEELSKLNGELTEERSRLEQMASDLADQEKALEDKENSFNEKVKAFEDRRVNLKQNAEYFVGMPPEDAVKILLEMEDMDIVDIFRITEENARAAGETSLVSYWLSKMPEARAAALTRKMARKVGG